jgi:two-component system alkaline phosphatase synthesis response regulator PhoP
MIKSFVAKIIANKMAFEGKKILIIDDEPDILKFVAYNLEKTGFQVLTANSGREGIGIARKENPDLIILDVMMPELDGIETCKELRELPQFNKTLITFLTARNEDYSQIAGFDSGADDYIIKPIRPNLLTARIKALFKRRNGRIKADSIVQAGCVRIDKEKRLVYKNDRVIELPKKEFDLLILLTSNVGSVFAREKIYQSLWSSDDLVGVRTIDVYIRKLRRKIGEDCIKTLKGVGYKYNEYCNCSS